MLCQDNTRKIVDNLRARSRNIEKIVRVIKQLSREPASEQKLLDLKSNENCTNKTEQP